MNFWDHCVVNIDKALMTRDLIQVTQTFLFQSADDHLETLRSNSDVRFQLLLTNLISFSR